MSQMPEQTFLQAHFCAFMDAYKAGKFGPLKTITVEDMEFRMTDEQTAAGVYCIGNDLEPEWAASLLEHYHERVQQGDSFKCLWEKKNGPDKLRCSTQCPTCAQLEAQHVDG